MTTIAEKCPVAENLHKDDVGNFLFTSESVGQGHPGKRNICITKRLNFSMQTKIESKF